METSQPLGLIHWNAAAPKKPTVFAALASEMRPALAIFHASHSRNAAPTQFNALRSIGCATTTWPSPRALQKSNVAIPAEAPSTQGRPRHHPAADALATIMVLLGPGVMAATNAKTRNAAA